MGARKALETEENRPLTLEGQVTKISDLVAYANHDLDDAIRSGIISAGDIPAEYISVLGETASQRINTMVVDTVEADHCKGRDENSDERAGVRSALGTQKISLRQCLREASGCFRFITSPRKS